MSGNVPVAWEGGSAMMFVVLLVVLLLVVALVLMSRGANFQRQAQTRAWAMAVENGQVPPPNPLAAAGLPDHPKATPALVLGILGLVGLPILAPFAWIIATSALKDAAAMPGRWRTTGSVQAGQILGIIGTLLLVIGIAIVAFWLVVLR